jgi:glutaredoxin
VAKEFHLKWGVIKMIKAYTMTGCPMCEELKKYMKDSNINFEEKNVDEDFTARAKLVSLDIEQMPAIEVDGSVYSEDVQNLKKRLIAM